MENLNEIRDNGDNNCDNKQHLNKRVREDDDDNCDTEPKRFRANDCLSYEWVPGVKINTLLLYVLNDNYLFVRNSKADKKQHVIYKCREKNCHSRVCIDSNDLCTRMPNYREHNHGNAAEFVKELKLKHSIKSEIQSQSSRAKSIREIFYEHVARDQAAGAAVNYADCARTLRNIRSKLIPQSPTTCHQIKEQFARPEIFAQFGNTNHSAQNGGNRPTSGPERITRKSIEPRSTAEIRKSLEALDDRKSTPPPVLTKKPIVPIKKSPTVGSVAGNIFSGLKQNMKSVEQKMTHHDGTGGSKMHHYQSMDDNGTSGIYTVDSEFDQVERSSLLQDMLAGRAKAPKRRLPTSNSISSSETLNDLNGDSVPAISSGPPGASNKLDEEVMKPKQREWEKNRVPWMDELKANQAKKTPNFESRSSNDSLAKSQDNDTDNDTDTTLPSTAPLTAKTFHSQDNSSESSSVEVRHNVADVRSTAKDVIHHRSKDSENVMTKSMSSLATKISIESNPLSAVTGDEQTENINVVSIKARPTSVTLRSNSISPISRLSTKAPNENGSMITTSTATITSSNDKSASVLSPDSLCSRVIELELRVQKLEKLVQKQNSTIETLLQSMKDESDKVKTLKHELDKYAQCVTQV